MSSACPQVPFATARAAAGGGACGAASVDLSSTDFCVDVGIFGPMGCSAWGTVLVPDHPLDEGQKVRSENESWAPKNPNCCPILILGLDAQAPPILPSVGDRLVAERLLLVGGGYVGRMSPELDATLDEQAAGGNYDNEGRSGGWVLQLLPLSTVDGEGHLLGEAIKSSAIRALANVPGGPVRPCWGCRREPSRGR